jgi:hypothetical protein
MDNCLIDDRRIHIDFSQSVSKLWGQFRQSKKNAKKGKYFLSVSIGFSFLSNRSPDKTYVYDITLPHCKWVL